MANFNRLNRVNAERKINEDLASDTQRAPHKRVDSRESEFNPVSPARAYGKKRKEIHLFEIIKLNLFRLIAIAFLYFLLSIPLLGLFAFLTYGNILVTFLFWIIFTVIVLHIALKPIRKRMRFVRKLKRLCKQKNYKLKIEQGFIDALFWSPDRIDFSLNTGRYTYLAHYLTVRKYRSAVTFCDKHSFYRTKFPPPNVFTIILGLKPRTKYFNVSFPEPYTIGTHKTVNSIIVNPVCRDLYIKNKDGVTEPTGSGASEFGYTVFTGSGFLETIVRNEESAAYKGDFKISH
jgi:hypothetical protein